MQKSSLASRFARKLLDSPKSMVSLLVIAVAFSAVMLPRLELEAGFENFYDGPLSAVRDRTSEHFVNDDLMFLVYRSDSVFSANALRRIREVGQKIEALRMPAGPRAGEPVVDEVVSLATIKDLEGSTLSFRTYPLVPDPVPEDPAELAKIERQARNNPVIRDGLLSEKGDVALATIRLPQEIRDIDKSTALELIRPVLRQAEAEDPSVTYLLTGVPAWDADQVKYQEADIATFLPVGYVLMLLVLFLFVRRLVGVLLAVAIATFNVVLSLAILVAIGGSLDLATTSLPVILLALSVAMFLHFISEYGKHASERPGEDVAHLTVRDLVTPLFVAALTTGIGFGSLVVADMPLIRRFGLSAGLGVMASFFIVLVAFALCIRRARPERLISSKGYALSDHFDGVLRGLANLVIRRRWWFVTGGLAYLVAVAVGITRVVPEFEELDLFDRDMPVRIGAEAVDAHLGGSMVYVVAIYTKERDRFTRPEELRKIAALEEYLQTSTKALRVASVVDFIKVMHREFYDGDPAYFRIPDSAEQTAQLVLLNDDHELLKYLDETGQSVRLVARNGDHNLTRAHERYEALEAYLAEQFPASAGYEAYATGITRLNSDLVTRLVSNLMSSLLLSFVNIFAIIFILFRNVRAALISILPNVIPVATGLGLMGWLDIELDPYTVTISTIILGIAVDDTVHFIQGLMARLRVNPDLEGAIRETFHIKGPAIIATTVAISAAFVIMVLSHFNPMVDFGVLVCLSMVSALLGDLLFLPALILVLRTRMGIEVGSAPKGGSS